MPKKKPRPKYRSMEFRQWLQVNVCVCVWVLVAVSAYRCVCVPCGNAHLSINVNDTPSHLFVQLMGSKLKGSLGQLLATTTRTTAQRIIIIIKAILSTLICQTFTGSAVASPLHSTSLFVALPNDNTHNRHTQWHSFYEMSCKQLWTAMRFTRKASPVIILDSDGDGDSGSESWPCFKCNLRTRHASLVWFN